MTTASVKFINNPSVPAEIGELNPLSGAEIESIQIEADTPAEARWLFSTILSISIQAIRGECFYEDAITTEGE